MADYVSSHTGAQIDAAVDNATKVTANPTLAGTEASLTGLEVGSTKYKVTDPSGTYLPLAGGTMTGNINIDNNNIVHGQYNIISAGGGEIAIGNSTDTPTIWTPSNKDINYSYEMLDAANTSANPTLDGTEANLTSLKLNGTKYAIPSGGGHLYQHNVSFLAATSRGSIIGNGNCNLTLFSTSDTAYTSTTLFQLFVGESTRFFPSGSVIAASGSTTAISFISKWSSTEAKITDVNFNVSYFSSVTSVEDFVTQIF